MDQLTSAGIDALRQGNAALGRQLLARAVAADPNNTFAQLWLALATPDDTRDPHAHGDPDSSVPTSTFELFNRDALHNLPPGPPPAPPEVVTDRPNMAAQMPDTSTTLDVPAAADAATALPMTSAVGRPIEVSRPPLRQRPAASPPPVRVMAEPLPATAATHAPVPPAAPSNASTEHVDLQRLQGSSSDATVDATVPSPGTLRLPGAPGGMALQSRQPSPSRTMAYRRSSPRQALARILWSVLDEAPCLLAARSGLVTGGTRGYTAGQVNAAARAALLCGIVIVLVLLSSIALTRPTPAPLAVPQVARLPLHPGAGALPLVDSDTAELAAIVYAEAQAEPVDFNEMLAIASVVHNRVEHVVRYPHDLSSFGGPSYHAVMSQPGQFTSYGSERYVSWLQHAFSTEAEQRAAEQALQAAVQVRTQGAAYPFVFFQQAAATPSFRAADPPTHLGSHNFWSFRPECVVPNACQP